MQKMLLLGILYTILFITWIFEQKRRRVVFAILLVGTVGQIKYL